MDGEELREDLKEKGKTMDNDLKKSLKEAPSESYCYVLINPYVLDKDVREVDLATFLSSIFYVGKGKGERAMAYFKDACGNIQGSRKLTTIDQAWNKKGFVYKHIIWRPIIENLALAREAAMIFFFKNLAGKSNFTNKYNGSFKGESAFWSREEKCNYGVYLLETIHRSIQTNGCETVKKEDVAPRAAIQQSPRL